MNRASGFTLIELVIVLVLLGILSAVAVARFIDLSGEARDARIQAQAQALVSNDTLNHMACEAGSDDCITFGQTGFSTCQIALDTFLPEVAEDFAATTYASSTPPSQWRDLPDPGEALFWVTRTVEVPFPQKVPCVLAYL
ncbi:MAG: type II secretion system protein [Xanthomonadales bacterium]|nr:type II secretion system protein [Xanthomonadales bacterium]